MREEPLQILAAQAKDYGIGLTDHQLGLFDIYLRELMRWNEKTNLTGLKDPARIVIELFLDSLVPSARIQGSTPLLDAGSGAGLPGLPLKILSPSLEVHLLEPRARRVSFLKQVVRRLGLPGIEVLQGQTQSDPSVFPVECYPVITARAIAPFPKTLRWCSPLLCRGGRLVCYLGEHGQEEIDTSREVARGEGLEVEEILPYLLPGKKRKRHVVILRRRTTD